MKKRRRTRRKSHKGLSAGPSHRRRRSLSAGKVMSKENLKNSAINAGLGALGGAGASVGMKLLSGITKGNTIANILAGAGVGLIASAFGAPKMGIGFTGGATALALSGGLSDNAEFADEDALEEGEIYQTESGDFVRMLNDGEMEYLSDEEIEALSEGEVIYPQYSTMNSFQQ